jgi:sugar (pentulose or hexulose) kinase
VAIPWVAQPNPLTPGTHGAAAFCGIGPETTRADCVRAVAMGLCCELARCFARLSEGGVADAVVLNGGAARGDAFRRAIATLFDPLPVYHPDAGDLAAACGSLHGFNAKRIRMRTARVRPYAGAKRASILAYWRRYLVVFERLYGNVPHAAPYCVARG